ncbi:MAG: noncanonical pyrimidine nucleotidase, YjjG family [Ruminococcaceae bacterium]|nr:noncanonical pyrimidine nucleotidase, YjjG family [Oscillospiraceae bacterium]
MIKTVFVDIDDTLLDFDKCAKNSIIAACKKYNIKYTSEIFDTFKKINTQLWLDIEKGNLTKSELHKVRWKLIFNELKIDADGIAFENMFFNNLSVSADPVDGASEMLKYLYSKYIICAATNAAYNQQVKRLKMCNMYNYIKYIFASEKLGFQKPTKEFFDSCFSALGNINKNETIIIGDSISADIIGGIEYGIKTCWFNKNAITTPNSLKIDYVVNNLCEIKNIL